MTDLVERLLERNTRLDAATPNAMLHFMDGIKPLIAEAATDLEAKDKELAALRERVKALEGERDHYLSNWKEARIYTNIETNHAEQAEARAETAERERDHFKSKAHDYFGWYDKALRERDEARGALRDILAECDEAPTDNSAWVVAIQKIARAITGEKQ